MAAPTELDFCVLGVIGRDGPLSAYRVRQHFASSPTRSWSSSAGSIYPAIRRLRVAGFVSASDSLDERGTRTLTITHSGETALGEWLIRVGSEEASTNFDPIRTRAHFLASLHRAGRKLFLSRSEASTKAALSDLRRRLAKLDQDNASTSERIGLRGGIAELRARLEWLREAADELLELEKS